MATMRRVEERQQQIVESDAWVDYESMIEATRGIRKHYYYNNYYYYYYTEGDEPYANRNEAIEIQTIEVSRSASALSTRLHAHQSL